MQYANYLEYGVIKNARFNLVHVINRDDSNYPYWLLREKLLLSGIELNTPDVNAGRGIVFELHMNARRQTLTVPAFVLLMEAVQIYPPNASQKLLMQYQQIFTWRDDLVNQERYVKINYPNKINVFHKLGFSNRNRFCCLIASNRSAAQKSPLDLYSERVKSIRWFERNAPQEFDLYGSGWEVSPPHSGKIGRLLNRVVLRLARQVGQKAFPSYRGRVASKLETLQNYRFSICYENVRDIPGYITEKIFDCFFSGCVPIYWGASNVADYIPRECFIDRRKFSSHEDLHRYLTKITEQDYQSYQIAIQSFLESPKAKPFSAEYFAEQISSTLLSALHHISHDSTDSVNS